MRNLIDIILESVDTDSLHYRIADQIEHGIHQGDEPYWKLIADSKTLDSMPLMLHIASLVRDDQTSGVHPDWTLKIIADEDEAPVAAPEHVVDEAIVDEAPKAKGHRVVAVHQKQGPGMGWWECPDEHAELFVVEDEAGEPVESYGDRNSADAHCHHLNTGEQMLDEVDVDPTDDADLALDNPHSLDLVPTSFMDSPDHEVEVAAIHERGPKQDEAMQELHNRGITLTPDQLNAAAR